MGLFSKIITHTIVETVKETTAKQVEEKIQKQPQKAPLFKSMREFVEFTCLYFFASQAIYIMILFVIQAENMSLGVFYQSCAIASLVSFALFLLGMLAYGLYRVDLLPLLFMIMLLPLTAILPIGFNYGFSVFGDFFLGVWMNAATKLIFFLLGIISIVSTLSGVCYYESEGTRSKTKKHAAQSISDEEAEKDRSMLRSSIQDNAITIRFLKRKWNFPTSADVLFGYDEQKKQFVFVSDKNSYTLSSRKVVYFDFEDVQNNPDVEINTNEYERLIKLFYLGSSKKENILSMAQIYANNEAINRIKYYANNNPAGNSEAIFRRKIRHLASTLERDFYPCRPFNNDEWFDQLKECMEKTKNNNTDGYSLFREKVISVEDYMDDEILTSIICDLSVDPPDKSSAKQEARKLCRQDFGVTLKNNLKSSFKSFFSNED